MAHTFKRAPHFRKFSTRDRVHNIQAIVPARQAGALIMTGDLVRASVLALVATATSAYATAAGPAFDGTWSVTAVTQQGGCAPTYNFSVQIAAGLITLPGFAGLSGHVTDSGAVQASVSTSGTQVTAFGNLAGSTGRGRWNSRSNDGTCAGYWTARAAAR
jgi:hypothetical protein